MIKIRLKIVLDLCTICVYKKLWKAESMSKLIKIGDEWDQKKGCFTATHLSASQLNLDLANWLVKYCLWDARKRKSLSPSVSMIFGGIVGSAVQDVIQHKLTIQEVMEGKKNV